MKIYTARHGQTDWNVAGKMQGQTDIPLNETGRSQAELLATKFMDIELDKIYTSKLSRAHETAQIINKHHNVELVADVALNEVSFGVFEGQSVHDPAVAAELDTFRKKKQPYPGSEPLDVFFKRISSSLERIVSGDDRNILIVGHYGTIRAVIVYLLKLTPEERYRYAISNTAVHCFERDDATGNFNMTIENDSSHLGYEED